MPRTPELRHELIESIYFADPNGYPIEITYEVRPMNEVDASDALETLEAAMQQEDLDKQGSERFTSIDQVWRRKAAARDTSPRAGQEAVLYVLDVPEYAALMDACRRSEAYRIEGPSGGYWRVSSPTALVFQRKALGFVPALWNSALTGGYEGDIVAFDRDRLEIRPAGNAQ